MRGDKIELDFTIVPIIENSGDRRKIKLTIETDKEIKIDRDISKIKLESREYIVTIQRKLFS